MKDRIRVPEILGKLILLSTNKAFYPLHYTWPCFFNAGWLQDEQDFSVILVFLWLWLVWKHMWQEKNVGVAFLFYTSM